MAKRKKKRGKRRFKTFIECRVKTHKKIRACGRIFECSVNSGGETMSCEETAGSKRVRAASERRKQAAFQKAQERAARKRKKLEERIAKAYRSSTGLGRYR